MRKENRNITFKYRPDVIQTCIGLVDDTHKTIVREDGSINYNFNQKEYLKQSSLSKEAMPPMMQTIEHNHCFDHRYRPMFHHRDQLLRIEQSYGDPRAAIVTTTEYYGQTTFSWTVFAHQDASGLRADIVRWSLEASSDFGHANTWVRMASLGEMANGPTLIGSKTVKSSACSDKGIQMISSGERLEGAFAFVLAGDLSEMDLTVEWAQEAEQTALDYWLQVRPFQERFVIPDLQIMDMLEACGRNILQAREIKDEIYEFQVGPTTYRGLWVVDGHFLLEAAHMMGRREEAYQGLLAVLKRVKPNGSIRIIPKHDKETGIAMATMVRQCELMNDDDRLRELWPTFQRSLGYIQSLREEAMKLGEEYPAYDLFPPAFADGGMGYHPEYTTPLWIMIGLKYAYRAGKRLGLEGHEAFKDLFDEVMAGFQRCTSRDMKVTEKGSRYFSMCMEQSDAYKEQTANWAYAHAIYPGEVLSPEDAYVDDFLSFMDELDDEHGIPKETGYFMDQTLWAYASMFYAQVWLYAGKPQKAIDYLYAFANHAAPNRVWVEEQYFTETHSNEYGGDMPHNWASAEFIRLVRHLLVMEQGDDLLLLPGLPDEWLPQEEALVLENTPTRYGLVSLQLSKDETHGYRLKYVREPGNQQPARVLIYWDGQLLQVEGADVAAESGMIVLPGDIRGVELHLGERLI
ncbi:MAG: hypothetical protein H7X86_00745 [Gorillibacterium sp.]|nr:hypothetical protein [Gorillibacterium sp.]